jgi:hypothetical protein
VIRTILKCALAAMLISSAAGLRGTPRPALVHANQVSAASETFPISPADASRTRSTRAVWSRARIQSDPRQTGEHSRAMQSLPLPELVWKIGITMELWDAPIAAQPHELPAR